MKQTRFGIAIVAIALAFAGSLDAGEPAAGQATRKPWLGMALVLRSDARGEKFLYVAQAPQELPAYRAGIRQGDLVTAIEGKRITFRDDLDIMEFTASLKVGKIVTLRVVRSGKHQDLRVRIGALPQEYESALEESLRRARAARAQAEQ